MLDTNMDSEHTLAAAAGHEEVCAAVLSIIFEYSLHKFDDTMAQLEVGRPKFLAVIRRFVTAGKKIEMCLPAFPFKSANKTYKVLGRLPDKAEELALARLESICQRIESIYPPGATIMIISDGLVYNGKRCPKPLGFSSNNSRLTKHRSSQRLRSRYMGIRRSLTSHDDKSRFLTPDILKNQGSCQLPQSGGAE
jgi:hypothetical protein